MSVPTQLMPLARTAPFVFIGTVRRPGGSNVELLASDEYPTAIVRVEDVIAAPEAVGDLTGRDITVHLSGSESPSRNSRHLFLATSLQFGDEIAVAEVGRMPSRRQVEDRLRTTVIDERLRAIDETQAERLRRATSVVYGVVRRIEPAMPEGAGLSEAVGEADPRFRAAVLNVWRTLKGAHDAEPRVIFPFPRTQKWSEVPLFVEGVEGVWILQPARGQSIGAGKVKVPDIPNGFTALDPLDFHTPGMLGRI